MVAGAQQMWAITNGLRKRAKRWIPSNKSLRTADRADLEGNGMVEEDVDDRSAMPIETSLREYPRQPFLFILPQLCVQKRIDVRCVSGDNWRKRSRNTKWTFGLPFDFYSKLTLAPIVLIWPDRHLRRRNLQDFYEKETRHHQGLNSLPRTAE